MGRNQRLCLMRSTMNFLARSRTAEPVVPPDAVPARVNSTLGHSRGIAMSKHQQTGMRGVYLVAAELAARGLIASPTSRSAAGADLLVTDENCANAFSVQVKTNAKPAGSWLAGQRALSISSRSHVYVFVNIQPRTGVHEFFIVPSKFVTQHLRVVERPKSTWYAFYKKDAEKFRSKWSLLGATEDVA